MSSSRTGRRSCYNDCPSFMLEVCSRFSCGVDKASFQPWTMVAVVSAVTVRRLSPSPTFLSCVCSIMHLECFKVDVTVGFQLRLVIVHIDCRHRQ